MRYADPVDSARSVAAAARALARTIRTGGDVETAADRLELNARDAVDVSERGFGPEAAPSDDELLATALTQLSIGTALCEAQRALTTSTNADQLESASTSLDATADLMENLEAAPDELLGFDSGPDRSAVEAGQSTLDSMGVAAAEVMAAMLNKLAKPIVDKVPEELKDHLSGDLPGRVAGLALRAVRRGLDLLSRLVSLGLIEKIRADIDDVLARLGQGEDGAVLAGWVIGVPGVRAKLTEPGGDSTADLRHQLDELAARFAKLCKLLRRIALVIAGLATTLAFIHITLPHAAAVTAVGLVLVVGTMIVLGRDYTGANDLPGPILGVRLLFEGAGHARA